MIGCMTMIIQFFYFYFLWVFEQKKDSETVEAEDVRDSLLELMRNRYRGWTHEMTATSGNSVESDQHQLHNHNQMGAYPHEFHS